MKHLSAQDSPHHTSKVPTGFRQIKGFPSRTGSWRAPFALTAVMNVFSFVSWGWRRRGKILTQHFHNRIRRAWRRLGLTNIFCLSPKMFICLNLSWRVPSIRASSFPFAGKQNLSSDQVLCWKLSKRDFLYSLLPCLFPGRPQEGLWQRGKPTAGQIGHI